MGPREALRIAFMRFYERRNPHQAGEIQQAVRTFAGLEGQQNIALGYASWKMDPCQLRPTRELRAVGVYSDEAPPTLYLRKNETHRRTWPPFSRTVPVTFAVLQVPVSPVQPYFHTQIARSYLRNTLNLRGLAVAYGIRALHQERATYERRSRQLPEVF